MQMVKLCSVAVAMALAVILASGQQAMAQGYEPDDPQLLAAQPHLKRYRDFEPGKMDLSADMPPPGDQGDQGSCVAWSLGYAIRSYYAHRRNQVAFSAPQPGFNDPQSLFSPAYLYNQLTRSPRTCDSGLSMVKALDFLGQNGIATASEFPYDKQSCARQPSQSIVQAARSHVISSYHLVNIDADDVKGQLAHGNPVATGLLVDIKAMSRLRSGQIYDEDSHTSHDGHAVALVGYDDTRQAFKFMNSWGRDWADQGFGWISYRAFEKDAHVAAVMTDGDAPLPPTPAPGPSPTPAPAPEPGGDWRPQLVALAKTFDCALLDVHTADGVVSLGGWVGRQQDLDALAAFLTRAAPQLRSSVRLRPWPQCEALLTLSEVVQDHGLALTNFGQDSTDYVAGSRLQLRVKTPDFPSFLYVTYIDASGTAVPLYQPRGVVPQALPPGTIITLGAGEDPRVFRVGPPFGNEMVVAVAAKSPLFSDGVAPRLDNRAYLSALRKTLEYKPDPNQPDRVVDGSVIALTTHAAASDIPSVLK